jgi:acyl-CoA synthetase (NDP forming)
MISEDYLAEELSRILWARSVAVVGASTNSAKLGHVILKNIVEGGYEGRVYPINPGADQILGLRAYPNLSSVPDAVDLAVFVVPASVVPGLMKEAGLKGIRGAVVVSGGFREAGNDDLEEDLVTAAREHGVRVIGPNCQGFNFLPNQLCASWPLMTSRGYLAIISQSGTVAATLSGWSADDGVGVSGLVSLGNQADLNETDFISFFGEDPSTRAIALYLEGAKDGRRFMQVAAAANKPVVVLKSGRTPGGERAAASHTRSLAGHDKVFSGACRQAGILRAETIEELYDLAKGLGALPTAEGNRLMIVTSSGGAGIIAVDVAEQNGLCVPPIGDDLSRALQTDRLPRNLVLGNPLDLTGDAAAGDYRLAVEIIDKHDAADLYLLIFGDPIAGAAEVVRDLSQQLDATVCACYLGGGEVEKDEVRRIHAQGLPVFPTPERAVRTLAALVQSCLETKTLREITQ